MGSAVARVALGCAMLVRVAQGSAMVASMVV